MGGPLGAGSGSLGSLQMQKQGNLMRDIYRQAGIDIPENIRSEYVPYYAQNQLALRKENREQKKYDLDVLNSTLDANKKAIEQSTLPEKVKADLLKAQNDAQKSIYDKIKAGIEAEYSDESEKSRLALQQAQTKWYEDPYGKKLQEALGTQTAKDIDTLKNYKSKMPELRQTVDRLNQLAQRATYTKLGVAGNNAMRQLGLPVGEGALNRAEYISTVDNQILPLLRDTFGAQFTEREGQTLRATLGNPDLSPEEKQAILNSFINQKERNILSQSRKVYGNETQNISQRQSVSNTPYEGQRQRNSRTGQTRVYTNGQWVLE